MTDEMGDELRRQVNDLHAEQQLIRRAWETATPRDRGAVSLVEYRCPEGCNLLVCWQSPRGKLIRVAPYRLAPSRNLATSSEAGRARNTRDGDRRWKAQFFNLDNYDGQTVPLICEDLDVAWQCSELRSDASRGRPGVPTRRIIPCT